MKRADEIGDGTDRIIKEGMITAEGLDMMGVAGTGRAHDAGMDAKQALGLAAGVNGDVGTHKFERVEYRSMLAHETLKILVPAERMRGDDRRFVLLDDRDQVGQRDAGFNVGQIGQAVNEKMPLARRDLRAGEKDKSVGVLRPLGQFVGMPLNVVLGDNYSVQAERSRRSTTSWGSSSLSGE